MAGATLACLGAAAAHDAMINDWSSHRGQAGAKLTTSTLVSLGGTEVVGRAYNIPVAKQVLSHTVKTLLENAQTLLGTGLIAAGVKAGHTALQQGRSAIGQTNTRTLNGLRAIGAGVSGAFASLAGTQLIGQQHDIPYADQALTQTLKTLASSDTLIGTTGAALTGGAIIGADQTLKNLKQSGNPFISAALACGSLVAGLGGIELVGQAAQLEQTQGLLTNNAPALQGLCLGAVGLAWLSHVRQRIQQDQLTGTRGLEVSAGAAATLSGFALAAEDASTALSTHLGTASAISVSGGLALATVGFGKQLQAALNHDKPEAVALNGALATLAAVGSLFILGDAVNSPMINKLGEALQSHTLEPLMRQFVTPALNYLYDNPIAGGFLMMAGAAALLHLRRAPDEDSLFD